MMNNKYRVSIPTYDLEAKYKQTIERRPNFYFGQPDMTYHTPTEKLVLVYPEGHGKGPLHMQISLDKGETWSYINQQPKSWTHSQETPTLYTLTFNDGSEKLILICGHPKIESWGDGSGGFSTSLSDEKGDQWSEFKNHFPEFSAVVAMASLIKIKKTKGEDCWMAVFNDKNFVNYKTYLTFNEQGEEVWSKPVPLMPQWRAIEEEYQLCEVGIFRSPSGKELVGICRRQAHNGGSMLIVSEDEGETWTAPTELPASLAGERHKIIYDNTTEKLYITFREIILDEDKDGFFSDDDWKAGDWLLWVGSYDDLISGKEGDFRIRLAEDFTPSEKSGDTGYAGFVLLPNRQFVLASYGVFFKEDAERVPENMNNHIKWTTSIVGVKIGLEEVLAYHQ